MYPYGDSIVAWALVVLASDTSRLLRTRRARLPGSQLALGWVLLVVGTTGTTCGRD